MFCSKNSSMLCMKCFSEASLETRLHCVDIDIAYEQRKKSLDLAISVIIDMRSQSQSFNITEISLPIHYSTLLFAVGARNSGVFEGRRSGAAVAVRRAEAGDDARAGGHPLAVHLALRDHPDAVRGHHAHHRRVGSVESLSWELQQEERD